MLRCDGNKQWKGCLVKNTSYCTKSILASEIKNIFPEILLPNIKPIRPGIVYQPSNQSGFRKDLDDSFPKLDTPNWEIYVFGNFNINFFLDGK